MKFQDLMLVVWIIIQGHSFIDHLSKCLIVSFELMIKIVIKSLVNYSISNWLYPKLNNSHVLTAYGLSATCILYVKQHFWKCSGKHPCTEPYHPCHSITATVMIKTDSQPLPFPADIRPARWAKATNKEAINGAADCLTDWMFNLKM